MVVDGKVQPGWGLHLIDMNLAMGNLVDIVKRQGEAWKRRAARHRQRATQSRNSSPIFCAMTGWIIAAAELRIPWSTSFAAHRMIVVVDPELNAVRQINGLASWYDRAGQRWRHKPIGYLRSDRLRGYDTLEHPRTFLPINGAPPGSRGRRRGDRTRRVPRAGRRACRKPMSRRCSRRRWKR